MSKELMPGETLVLRVHQHWVTRIRPLLLPLALLVLVILLDFALGRRQHVKDEYKVVATLAALALLGLVAILVWVSAASRHFTVTDRRVILATGVLNRTSKVIALDRVQDITVNQSLLGRMLGYGRIEIDAAGASGAEILAAVPRPERFRDEVFVRAEKMRTAGPEEPAPV